MAPAPTFGRKFKNWTLSGTAAGITLEMMDKNEIQQDLRFFYLGYGLTLVLLLVWVSTL